MNDVIYGRRAVFEALEASIGVERLLLAESNKDIEIIRAIVTSAREAGVPVETTNRGVLDRISGGAVHQGVVALAKEFSYASFEEVVEQADPRIVLMDGVTDPQNLGSILRTAQAFGWSGVLIPKRRSVGVTPSVRKVAAGAAESVPVARIGSPAEALMGLRKKGFVTVALDPAGGKDFREVDYEAPLCLVLGAEGAGMKKLVRDRCDFVVRIPMVGAMASLNVAVAAAVVMVEVTRSRGLDNS